MPLLAGLRSVPARMLRQPSDIRPEGGSSLRLVLSTTGTRNPQAHVRALLRRCLQVSLALSIASHAHSQSQPSACTTQSAMTSEVRQSLADTALALAMAIKGNDTERVRSMSAPAIASNFDSTVFVIHQTSAAIANDNLVVTQLYRLDASSRKPNDPAVASFGCPLAGSTNEVEFSIPGLPPGIYAFVVVEANGDRPWMLPILLQQQGADWKMAGFYPHARTTAGHDGLWYWTTARANAKAGKKWLAWVQYGEADQLLRPANFIASTHLDQLRDERRTNAPGELSDGISAETPLVIKAKDGPEFHFTSLGTAATDDGKALNLVLHYQADSVTDSGAANTRNTAAASAMLTAHPELREGFSGVSIFAEAPGQTPFVTAQSLAEIH